MPRIRADSIDEHKTLTRRALMDAAKAMIAEAGTAEVPLGEVALSAGVGRTTLYEYFTDRDDLIATLVEDELPGVLEVLIGDVQAGSSAAEKLVDLACGTVEFVANDAVLGLILHREVGRMGREAQDRIRKAHADLSDAMVGYYFEAVETGDFRPMPPDLAGRLIQDVIMSCAKTVISAANPEERIGVVTENLRLFLLGALAAPGVAPR